MSSKKEVDSPSTDNTQNNDKKSLLATAKAFSFVFNLGVLPCRSDKQPMIDSVIDKRNSVRTMEELNEYFDPENGGMRAKYLGILLDSPVLLCALDLDGRGMKVFMTKILPRCSEQLQKAINETTRTQTPSNSLHLVFRYLLEDFPDRIKTHKYWQATGAGAEEEADHNEVNLMGTGYYLVEYGPGYKSIIGLDSLQTLNKVLMNELLRVLQKFETEINAFKVLCSPEKLTKYYHRNNRDALTLSLSGYLHRNGTPEYLIHDLQDSLMESVGGDEEAANRHDVIQRTCAKSSDKVNGYTPLLNALEQNKELIREINREFTKLGYQGFFDKPGAGGSQQQQQQQKKNKEGDNTNSNKEDEIKPTEKYEYLQFYRDAEVFAEAVSIAGSPRFAMVNMQDKSQITLVREIRVPDKIDDDGNVLSEWVYCPFEDYSYINKQYAFDSEEDFFNTIEFVQNKEVCTLDSLYWLVKSIWAKYIDAEDNHLSICAADTIYSYFQDVIGLTHYLFFVGDNDSGKSNNLVVFHYLGYRNMMSLGISAANIYGFLGSGEEGIGTICEDEANNIDEDRDKMDIAKSGYMKGFPVVKTTISDRGERTQRRYNTFCLKLYSAEKAPDPIKGKGLNQRLVKIKCIAGDPDLDIAEVVNPAGDPELEGLLKELRRVRNMLLCYRMAHRNDRILNISINLRNREKQLFKPLLRLFQNTKVIEELSKVVSSFVNERRMIKSDSLHAFLIRLVDDMVKEEIMEDVSVSGAKALHLLSKDIWTKVQEQTNGLPVPGHPLSYECVEFGTISQKVVISILEDVFKAEVKSLHSERRVIFQRKYLDKVLEAYEIKEIAILTTPTAVKTVDVDANTKESGTDGTLSTLCGKVYTPSGDSDDVKKWNEEHDMFKDSTKEPEKC